MGEKFLLVLDRDMLTFTAFCYTSLFSDPDYIKKLPFRLRMVKLVFMLTFVVVFAGELVFLADPEY
jgi:hypothetical protein